MKIEFFVLIETFAEQKPGICMNSNLLPGLSFSEFLNSSEYSSCSEEFKNSSEQLEYSEYGTYVSTSYVLLETVIGLFLHLRYMKKLAIS